MKNLIVAGAIVIIGIPFSLRALANNNINLNGLALDFAATVTEIITRRPSEWRAPAQEQRPPQQEPPNQL